MSTPPKVFVSYLRHVTASGGAVPWWSYDSIRKTLHVELRRGAADIEVCSLAKPRYAAFPIVRVGEDTWRVVPARYISRGANGELIATPHVINEELGLDFIQLINAPESVAEEISGLSDE
jgi:hypothetical protein